jgi:hypothetical protein
MKIFPVPQERKLQFSPEEIRVGEWREAKKGLLETRAASSSIIVAAYYGDISLGYLGNFKDLSVTESPESLEHREAFLQMINQIKQDNGIGSFEFWLGGASVNSEMQESLPQVQNDRDYTIQQLLEEGANEGKINKQWLNLPNVDISVKLNSANGVLLVERNPRSSE